MRYSFRSAKTEPVLTCCSSTLAFERLLVAPTSRSPTGRPRRLRARTATVALAAIAARADETIGEATLARESPKRLLDPHQNLDGGPKLVRASTCSTPFRLSQRTGSWRFAVLTFITSRHDRAGPFSTRNSGAAGAPPSKREDEWAPNGAVVVGWLTPTRPARLASRRRSRWPKAGTGTKTKTSRRAAQISADLGARSHHDLATVQRTALQRPARCVTRGVEPPRWANELG
jgi:hypothetical protein